FERRRALVNLLEQRLAAVEPVGGDLGQARQRRQERYANGNGRLVELPLTGELLFPDRKQRIVLASQVAAVRPRASQRLRVTRVSRQDHVPRDVAGAQIEILANGPRAAYQEPPCSGLAAVEPRRYHFMC